MTKYFFSLLLLLSIWTGVFAQDKSDYILPISALENGFDGAGIQWILERADGCQFVLFGEQHGVAGIAEMATFTLKQLQPDGFHHLILETDGWTTRRSAESGVFDFTLENPHSIAFDSDGDLRLMQTAIEINPSSDNPIWGVDQMQTAIHPFKRLVELATNSKQRRMARGAFLKAALKMGRYTRQTHFQDLNALEEVFSTNNSPEKDQILKEIRITMEIFSKWMNPATRQESIQLRETLMKQNLDQYLTAEPSAKAVLKMGGAHTMYGVGANGVLTLGDHMQKAAERNRLKVLNISIQRYNPENSLISDSAFTQSDILLIDNQEFLKKKPEDSLNTQLIGFDAIIYLKDAPYAGKLINGANEKKFRNAFIKSLLPLAFCTIICLIMVMYTTISGFLKRKSPHKKLILISGLGSVLMISLVTYQIKVILQYPAHQAAITSGTLPMVIHLLFGLLSLTYIYTSIKLIRSEASSKLLKVGYALFAMSFTLDSYMLYFWNIGGML